MNRSIFQRTIIVYAAVCGLACQKPDPVVPITPQPNPIKSDVEMWLTRPDQTALLNRQSQTLRFGSVSAADPNIEVDSTQTYQPIEGFGFALTGSSAYVLNRGLPAAQRATILRELFSNDSTAAKFSYIRISIGASDLSPTVFTYADSPTADPNLTSFSIEPERADLIPILREVIAIRPDIRIMATPWTAPVWMKTNGQSVGGSLKSEYQAAYAQYFVKYIQAMAAEGIQITSITPQNEPGNPYNNPSMLMNAEEQRDFIKNHLGPALQGAGLATQIIVYDHNCDLPSYPLTILNDPQAKPFVAGSAFHLYAGDISAMGQVQNAHPDRGVYFTEQYVSATGGFGGDLAWHTRNIMVGASRNGARAIIEWNLANDAQYGPHTPGGCTDCLGALTVANNSIKRNTSYYIVGHSSRWVPPGSVRIKSSEASGLPNVAYLTPDGRKVLVVLNDSGGDRRFNITFKGRAVQPLMPNGSVATFIWK
jgi:glucosylceramidase